MQCARFEGAIRFQRATAAFLAASERCVAVNFADLALPPLRPPRRPSSTAAGSRPFSILSSTWPVAISTISLPSWIGSRGRLSRLVAMLPIWHRRRSDGTGRYNQTDPLPIREAAVGKGGQSVCWRLPPPASQPPGAPMPVIPEVLDYLDELTQIRRDIHAHPELGFTEERTGDLVAQKLAEYGCEVHRGLAKTGVVGTIRRGNSLRAIGLRADMDCLPMQEHNNFAHRSTHDGLMHACGHDGHTTMLLGAARYLAKTRNFEGTVHFIFQPGEEGYGGGRVMVQEGLFEKFPCDAVFAMHNKPGIPIGAMAGRPGAMLAASDRFDIHIKGRGGHAAHPHYGIDPFVIGAQIVLALQTIPSRDIDPVDSAVISVGFMRGGSAYNVIPDELHIGGTVRSFRPEVRDLPD